MSNEQPQSYEWRISRKPKQASEASDEPPYRLGVLISGSGTNLQSLIDAIERQELPGVQITLVVSNQPDAYGLVRAQNSGIPTRFLPWQNRAESENRLRHLLSEFQVDLIVLAGWMRILSADFLAHFPNRVINIHPALLPDDGTGSTYTTSNGTQLPVFRGLHAVKQALDAGVKITGSSVHYVTPEVDAGPVICREEVSIEPGDTEESLHERLKAVEHRLIVEAVRRLSHAK